MTVAGLLPVFVPVLVLVLWTSLVTAGSYMLDGVKVYEVVRPIRMHDRHKRELESSRPDTLKYAMTLGGKHIEMHLERNEDLLTKDYTETHYAEDGTPIVTKPKESDLCYYQGKILNDSSSMVSMSTCDGLRGYFQTAEQRFLIEPMSNDSSGDHAVLKFEDVKNTPSVCGVTNTTWDSNTGEFPPRTGKSRGRASGPTLFQQQKYNEFFLVADNRMYQKMDSDVTKVKKRIYEIINFVNAVYKPINTFIALVGLEIWSDSDKIAVTTPAGETLDKFTAWRNDVLLKRQRHDNAHLLTAIDFDGPTVGLAFIGTLCSGHSTGVVQDHNPRAIAVGATLSHEMGHNLGMNHDSNSCICPDDSCIMAAALSYNIPERFSSCSSNNYEDYLNSRNPACLFNQPPRKELIQPSVCGNGFVEMGEECDCGSVTECTNPCCNATTCRLTKGSVCADGECCRDCKLSDLTVMCRAKRDECDLPEYCTGSSNTCPEDVFAVNGLPCKSGSGYCYNGQCPQRDDQCVKMWGANSVVGSAFCYSQNERGLYYAYCSRPSNDKYIGCQKQDVMCGKLFCDNGQDSPNYGRFVKFASCKATFFSDRDNDFGQVEGGTKCGDGKVCSQNQCVDLEVAYRATNCSAKCKGHGVCNHKLECTCEPGWLPPDCEKLVDSSGLSRTAIIAIAVIICIMLGVVLMAVAVYLMKRRNSRPRQTGHLIRDKETDANDNGNFGQQRTQAPAVNYANFGNQRSNPPPPPTKPPMVAKKPMRPKGAPPPLPPPSIQPSGPSMHMDFRGARPVLRPPPPPPKV